MTIRNTSPHAESVSGSLMVRVDAGATAQLKKPYAPPGLTPFGDLRALTQAGSGAMWETGMGMRTPKP